MKKGRKFYENENLIIYVGTAIFFILAISVGIVMYMTTKANSKVGNETGKSTTENIENVEWFLENYPYEMESLNPSLCEELHSETTEKGYLQLLPGVHKTDGFFLARFRKK